MTTFKQSAEAIASAPQKIMQFLLSPVIRIFSPSDDNYPATGVQPFDGDPAHEKHQ
ncbi:MAG: hypothetical protein MUF49_26825 [Oculatellaceae cyanobacterium Prado106]|jgi:hypothetical protein|nr:hypothetical protein [Oculatellaceae cyanobacterium Prado106]